MPSIDFDHGLEFYPIINKCLSAKSCLVGALRKKGSYERRFSIGFLTKGGKLGAHGEKHELLF